LATLLSLVPILLLLAIPQGIIVDSSPPELYEYMINEKLLLLLATDGYEDCLFSL